MFVKKKPMLRRLKFLDYFIWMFARDAKVYVVFDRLYDINMKDKKKLGYVPVVDMKVKLVGNPFDEQLGEHGDMATTQTITQVMEVDHYGTSGYWIKTDLYSSDWIDAAWFRPASYNG